MVEAREGTGRRPRATGDRLPRPPGGGCSAVDGTDYVGGHDPATADAGNAAAGWTLNAATGVFSGSGSGKAHAFAPVTVSTANVTAGDFGWDFDTVCNTT